MSATPAVLAGILTDRDFRSIILSSVSSWIRKGPGGDGADDEK
jgi:hypothetical protein